MSQPCERGRLPERPNPQELTPRRSVIDALRGVVSEPTEVTSYKTGPPEQTVVCLAKDGPGLFGLTNWKDNKEWSGITNHVLLSARYSVYLTQKLKEKGFQTDPQRVLDGMIVSHVGRRQWDEAGWYRDDVENAASKRAKSNETLGLELVQGKVPQDAFELVVALAYGDKEFSVNPAIYQSLDFRVAIYVDHRTSQKFEPLNTRMGDFLINNFFDPKSVSAELRNDVYGIIGNIILTRKEKPKSMDIDFADSLVEQLGASIGSSRLPRKELMRLILQDADTEKMLEQADINPNNIDDKTVPMPKWEDNFRKEYVAAARDEIIELQPLEENFPSNTWWGKYARKLY